MAEKFEVLDDREHVLKRPHIMVGAISEEEYSLYINGIYKKLKVVPGLLVLAREIIDNSVDEFIRSKGKFATKIKIDMYENSLTVTDNGRGIPVEEYSNSNGVKGWRPVLCWTELRSGTSFTEHPLGPGQNGVGSSICNILSKKFIGETWDGKKSCKVTCTDNMAKITFKINDNTKHPSGTKVVLYPDFERFGVTGYSEDHILATRERIVALSSVYPEITFVFNGERIRTKKPKEYIEIYNKSYVLYEGNNYFFGIMPTELDEYYHQCTIDGLFLKGGGTHEQYIVREICTILKDMIKKKYKFDISNAEIKKGFFFVFNARCFPNLKFDSQTKERLTNSEAEVKEYIGDVDFNKVAKQIMNTQEIIDPIIEIKLAKQIASEKRATTLAQKKHKNVYIEKYIPAKSNKPEEKNIYLCEGLSAASIFTKVRNINRYGCYPLKGFITNIYGMKENKIIENQEILDIMTILGLKFGMKGKELKNNLTYNKICLLADNDNDGAGGINPLLINFFYLWPDLYKMGMIYIVQAPRYIIYKNFEKKNEERTYCYTKEEFEKIYKKGNIFRFIKGIGGLEPIEYREMLEAEDKYIQVDLDDAKCLEIMFSPNAVNERRKIMEI